MKCKYFYLKITVHCNICLLEHTSVTFLLLEDCFVDISVAAQILMTCCVFFCSELFEVNHIRTIYHMFIALLILFILSTLVVDFIDEGR